MIAADLLSDVDRGLLAGEAAQRHGVVVATVSNLLRRRRKEANPPPKTDAKPPKPRPQPLPDQHAPQQKPGKKRRLRGADISRLAAQGCSAEAIALQLGTSVSVIYRSPAFRPFVQTRSAASIASHVNPPKPPPRPRISPPLKPIKTCPGCHKRGQLMPHGYCFHCEQDAKRPDEARVRPDPPAPAGYFDPDDTPNDRDPPGTPTPQEIRAYMATHRAAREAQQFTPPEVDPCPCSTDD